MTNLSPLTESALSVSDAAIAAAADATEAAIGLAPNVSLMVLGTAPEWMVHTHGFSGIKVEHFVGTLDEAKVRAVALADLAVTSAVTWHAQKIERAGGAK